MSDDNPDLGVPGEGGDTPPLVPPPAAGPGGPHGEIPGTGTPPPPPPPPGAFGQTPPPPPPGAFGQTPPPPPAAGLGGPTGQIPMTAYGQPPGVPYGQQPTSQNNSFAIAALVTGIVGVIPFCCGPLVGIVAIILGVIGTQKAKEMGGVGNGMAVAGIVLGAVGFLLSTAWIIWLYA